MYVYQHTVLVLVLVHLSEPGTTAQVYAIVCRSIRPLLFEMCACLSLCVYVYLFVNMH